MGFDDRANISSARPRTSTVRVGHLDTAVDAAVVSLRAQAATDRRGRLLGVAPSAAGHAHGTATALAILRAAPAAALFSIAVVPEGETVARLVAGLDWVRGLEVHVLCLALGLDRENVVLDPLIDALCAAGTLVVAAIGNDGAGVGRQPALHPAVLAVGACDEGGRVHPSSGSVFEPERNCSKPDLVAPSSAGTSFACAQVAGIAADLWGRHPQATAGDIRAALVASARRAEGAPGHRAGAGLVCAIDADRWLRSATFGRSLAALCQRPGATVWVDPRLQRHIARARVGQPVRAVIARDTTRVVELPSAELGALIADASTRAACATDVSVWQLPGF